MRTRGGLDWAVHVSSRMRGGPRWNIAGRIPDVQCEWWHAAWIFAGIAGCHAGHPSQNRAGGTFWCKGCTHPLRFALAAHAA